MRGVYDNPGTRLDTLLMNVSTSRLLCAHRVRFQPPYAINQALAMLETYQLDKTPV